MNVLMLSSSLGLFGGEGVVLNLIRGLSPPTHASLGYFHNAHNPHDELARAVRRYGHVARRIACSGPFDPRAVGRIARVIRKDRINLVHTHGYKTDIYGYFAARLARIPIVATVHSLFWDSPRMRHYVRFQRNLLTRFDAVACVSEPILEELRRGRPLRRPPSLIANGIDTEGYARSRERREAAARQWNLDPDGVYLGSAGRLSHEKGFDVLIRAAALVAARHPAHLLVGGEGPEADRLRALARELGIEDRVHFLGLVADMPGFYSLADVFVLASRIEGLPLVILEAMAAGTPVVATDVGDVGTVIRSGETGALAPPEDPAHLAERVISALTDPDSTGAMAEAGHRAVEERHGRRRMAEAYQCLYDQVLRGGNTKC